MPKTYIGETERSLKTRFLEQRRPSLSSSEVSQHIRIESPGHHVDISKITFLDRDARYFQRGVNETAYIRAYKTLSEPRRGAVQAPRSL
jgi:hypothetical protein